GAHPPSRMGTPACLAQSWRIDLALHTALAHTFAFTEWPEAACVRSSNSTGTSPAHIAPRYATPVAELIPQLSSTRSPGFNPAERNRPAKPAICVRISAAPRVSPEAASTSDEFSLIRSSSCATKLWLGGLCILQSAEFRFHDSAD